MRTRLSRALRRAPWLAPLALTLLAAGLRLAWLGRPQELMFDETYYVKDAWTLLQLGYEGTWGDDPNPAFEAGDASGFTDEGAFIAHPPLGKWLIAAGLAAFGPETAFAWRVTTALAGSAMVPVLYAIAHRVTRSAPLAALAGLLLALDGIAIAMSRIALLDTFLALLILVGFWCVVRDRSGARGRIRSRADRDAAWGRIAWRRPWIIAAGAAFGLAAGVKWSGLYALAIAGIGIVVADAIDRRREGQARWVESAVLRQGPASFALLVPPALIAYLATWTGWLVTSGGYDRAAAENPLAALWGYHVSIYRFHVGVTSEHTYASPAWQWPLLWNPTLMERTTGPCAIGDGCVGVLAALPNPLVWWIGMVAIAWILVRTVRAALSGGRIPGGDALVLAGTGATFAPWLLLPNRTMFLFYAVAIVPFAILAFVLLIRHLRRPRPLVLLEDPTPVEIASARAHADARTDTWRVATAVGVGLCLLVGVFFLPFATGMPLPDPLYRAHLWLPSWFL